MRKCYLLAVLFLVAPLYSFAQDKIPEVSKRKTVVSDLYNRCGVSVVTITRGDRNDALVVAASDSIPQKFDNNKILSRTVSIKESRGENAALSPDAVKQIAIENNLGKDVISYIFNRRADGRMDDSLLKERGLYNATDQDIIKARASQVGISHLAEDYDKLIKSAYVVLFDISEIKQTESYDKKTGTTSVSYTAIGSSDAYKVNFDLDELWAAWIYDDDTPSIVSQKNAAFDKIDVDLSPAGHVSILGSGSTPEDAVANAYNDVFFKLDKQIEAWQVKIYVTDVKPIKAKIGTKEGLSNGQRFRTYTYRENNHGSLVSVKRGYVRATTISSNNGIATGETEPSCFYQISGSHSVEPGWLLVEKKDLKIGGSLSFGMSYDDFAVGVDFDYLIKIREKGNSVYGLVSLGYLVEDGFLYADLGAGYQFRFGRFFSIMPYATVGVLFNEEQDVEDYCLGFGIKPILQVKYPWQVSLKMGAQAFAEYGVMPAVSFGIRREF